MPEQFDSHNAMAAFDHDSTLVVALELSGKSWQAGAVVPGVARRPRRRAYPPTPTSVHYWDSNHQIRCRRPASI